MLGGIPSTIRSPHDAPDGSPVLRNLLTRKRKSNDAVDHVDEVEDGARAQIAEELVVAATFDYAQRHGFLRKVERVDWDLLRIIKRVTASLEVSARTEAEWEATILLALTIGRYVEANGVGRLRGDLVTHELTYEPPT